MTRVMVEVLHTATCASWRAAWDRVESVAREEGVPIALEERVIGTPDEARAQRFLGSPTVRVGGRDVEPGAEAQGDFGLG